MHATDADKMTPQQRLEEIADILAGRVPAAAAAAGACP